MKCILSTEPEKRYKAADVRQHPWFKQYNKGAVYIDRIDNEDIPINEEVLDLLEEYRFDKRLAAKYIRANKHNHETTTYYLLLKKYEKENPQKKKALQNSLQLMTDDQNMTQPPKYPQHLSVSQRVDADYFVKNQLNQTLPAGEGKNNDSMSINKVIPTSANVPIHKVYLETSKAEQMAGINVSYDNSFNAIKKDIQLTVGRGQATQKEEVPADQSYHKAEKPKHIVDELPPNKPNEAIMISDYVKVNERGEKKETMTPHSNTKITKNSMGTSQNEANLNHTMPDEFNNSIGEVQPWQKLSASRVKEHYNDMNSSSFRRDSRDEKEKAARDIEKGYNAMRNTLKSKTKPVYKTNKPKTSINSYGVAASKRRDNTTNNSYSSRPKTSNHYLNNIPSGAQTKKAQVKSFLTQSVDSQGKNSSINPPAKKQSETYDHTRVAENSRTIGIDDASTSVRHKNVNQTNFRTIQDQNSSVRESDILQSESITTPTEVTDDMKIYRGPFSVS